ncbi:MAG: hypothetical protein L3J95_06540 [Thermoplasmata archaeon]|nr:hypothetical protein [Thermoplasmata archaeon]
MRPIVAAALGIVAVLIATSLLVPGLGRGESLAPAHGSVPSATLVTVTTTNFAGGFMNSFYTGQSSGRVFFTATDSSADTAVTVSINDHNATRDGLTNPVKTWTGVGEATHTNQSYLWGFYYLIPVNLVFGGQWNITVQGTAGGFAHANFTVTTYLVLSLLSPRVSLPAEAVSVPIFMVSSPNDAPYTAVTSVVIWGNYTSPSGTTKLPNTPVRLGPTVASYYNFTMPNNAQGAIDLQVYANTFSAGYNVTASSFPTGYVGNLSTPTVTLSSCPVGCVSARFAQGSPVYVSVTELIAGGGFEGAPGVTVGFKFEKGSSFVTPPGNPPASLITDGQGHASITFLASNSVFSNTIPNAVVVTVTDPADPTIGTQTSTSMFTIFNATTSPNVLVNWASAEYYSGATASFHWAIGGQNASVTAGWTGSYWIVQSLTSSGLYDVGRIATGLTSGTVSVSLPVGLLGTVAVDLYASNATRVAFWSDQTDVEAGTLLLTPDETHYLPGDTVHVAVTTFGPALSGAALWGTVVDSRGNWIMNSAVSGGTVTISVPSNVPPTSYTVTVIAQTPTGGTIANAMVSVSEAAGVDLNLGISTPSNYLDGSYQPGQTVTVSYTFSARGTATLPATYTLVLTPSTSASTGYTGTTVHVTGASGSFQYTIPKDAPNGLLYVSASATLGGPGCPTYCATGSQFTANVNGNPATLSYQLGNTGITVGALVAIIVLLLLGLGAFVMMRRRGGMGGRRVMMKPEPSSSTSTGATSSSSSGSPPSSSS